MATYHRLEIAGLVALSVLVAVLTAGSDFFTLESGTRRVLLYEYERGNSRSEVPRAVTASIDNAWQPTAQGLALAPGRRGEIAIRLDRDDTGPLLLFLDSTTASPLLLTVFVSSDGLTFREAAHARIQGTTRHDLTPAVAASNPLWLRIHVSNDAAGSVQDTPALTRIRVLSQAPPLRLYNVPLACLLVLTPVLAYATRATLRRSGALPYGLAVLAGLAALLTAHTVQHDLPPSPWGTAVSADRGEGLHLLVPYLLLLTILGWHARIWLPSSPLHRLWTGFALAGILAWAGNIRLRALTLFGVASPNNDTIEYLGLAAAMSSPYDTAAREPLWIWMVKAWSLIAGYDTLSVRIFTILLSVIVLAAACKFFMDYTGHPVPGLLVAALLSVNPHLITLSTRGLRDEAFMAAVLCVTYFVFIRSTTLPVRSQAAGLALAGAAVQLLRFNSYLFLIPLLLFWGWRQRSAGPHYVLLPFVFIAAVSAPHLIHNFRAYGDPMYSINVHAPWARNQEFLVIKQTGCEGCPNPEELSRDLYAGAPVTAAGYLLGMHGVQELASVTGSGYLELYLTPTDLFATQTGTRSAGGYALYLVGLALMLCGPHRELLALTALLANVTPFVVMMGAEPRIMLHSAPYATFVMIYALYWLQIRFATRNSRGSLTAG